MIKKLLLFASIVCLTHMLIGMESIQDNSHLFAAIPNKDRRLFVMPLLEQSATVADARNVLFSIGLVSKQSYEQMNCIFFMRDVVKCLATQYNLPEGSIALKINSSGSRKYKDFCTEFFLVMLENYSNKETLSHFAWLIKQGADCNFNSVGFGTTPLMRAVILNKPALVEYFIKRGARVDVCNRDKKHVRDFNIIYDRKQLKSLINPIVNFMEKTDEAKIVMDFEIIEFNEAKKIIHDALVIDKMLEECGAISCIRDINNPLIRMMSGNRKRHAAVKKVFEDDYSSARSCVPKNIMHYLYPRVIGF